MNYSVGESYKNKSGSQIIWYLNTNTKHLPTIWIPEHKTFSIESFWYSNVRYSDGHLLCISTTTGMHLKAGRNTQQSLYSIFKLPSKFYPGRYRWLGWGRARTLGRWCTWTNTGAVTSETFRCDLLKLSLNRCVWKKEFVNFNYFKF